jgi:hypothetical protein
MYIISMVESGEGTGWLIYQNLAWGMSYAPSTCEEDTMTEQW